MKAASGRGYAWLAGLLLAACTPVVMPVGGSSAPAQATAARTMTATVLPPESIPAALITSVLPPAQQAADDASRRRGIDLFRIHDNPVGLQVRSGGETAHVLSFLGTSKERHTLNVELRALVGAGKPGFIMNYSGPVTQGRAETAMPAVSRSSGLQFELLSGLPGGGVTDAYGDYLEHWAERLQQRFGARDFAFDDTPLVFALAQGAGPEAFVFCNQRSRLVLGDRKYADVQAVTAMGADGRWLGGYTLVGWNAKTPDATANPRYRLESDSRFGTLAQFGELP